MGSNRYILRDDKGRYFSGTFNRNVNRWVDNKDRPEHKRFVLALQNHGYKQIV